MKYKVNDSQKLINPSITLNNIIFSGHGDSVIAAEFSYDGVYLATGDMAGDIQVFKVTQNYKKVWEYSMGDMGWMKWHTGANVLMAGAEAGETYIWRIPSGDCKVLQGNGSKSETASVRFVKLLV
jgi:angio-associated migratory cell protein